MYSAKVRRFEKKCHKKEHERIQNIFSDCRRGNRKGNPLLFLIQHLHCYNVHCRKWRWLEQKLAMALARLRKELKDLVNGADVSGVNASPRGDDLTHLVGNLKGPEGTPYEKGVFFVDIKIPQQYPFEPPKMKFETKIWHPNISSQTGAICLDILKDKWSPALTIKTALLSLQALLSSPEPDDPQDAQVAGMYKADRAKFNETAAKWTELYAGGEKSNPEVEQIVAMGFSKEAAIAALASNGGDVNAAVQALLG